MGHTRTQNFQLNINLLNGGQIVTGCMNYKQGKSIAEFTSGGNYKTFELWPQTKTGDRFCKGSDVVICRPSGIIQYYKISELSAEQEYYQQSGQVTEEETI
jgi:hypothetical protein